MAANRDQRMLVHVRADRVLGPEKRKVFDGKKHTGDKIIKRDVILIESVPV